MLYNTQFGARDIFMNPKLAGVFPQFSAGEKLKNVYSYADTEARVQAYLVGALNGTVTAQGEITVKGQHQSVMNRVRQLAPIIEALFNNMPQVVRAIRRNTPLYLPFATMGQIEKIKTPTQKQQAFKWVMDNMQYNDDFNSLNSVKNESPDIFRRNKKAWETRVGRRVKKI